MENSTPHRYDRRFAGVTLLWSLATVILVGLTWKLWLGTSDFPQVPIFGWLVGWPLVVDWVLLSGLTISCFALLLQSLAVLLNRHRDRDINTKSTGGPFGLLPSMAIVFVASLAGLLLLNQHRLQPWAWQAVLYALIIVVVNYFQKTRQEDRRPEKRIHHGGDSQDAITAARWLTASIYFYSAIGKFDYQFLHGLGKRLADTGLGLMGLQPADWLPQTALAMPVFELLISVFLLMPVLRKWGVAMAVIFHGSLLLTLGPWGLGHHTAVLVWNLFFMLITIVLFWPARDSDASPGDRRTGLRTIVLTSVLVMYPMLPWCDHWLAWGLYSPNNSRVDLEVIRQDKAGVSRFERFDLGYRSLQQLNVPLYPEARFQLGVATALVQSGQLKTPSRIIVRSRSDRFTGQRDGYEFKSETWQRDPAEFLLNWRPRWSR